jgi:hypothetical protein
MKLTTHLHLVPSSRMLELYHQGVVLNELSAGTTYDVICINIPTTPLLFSEESLT